MCLIRVKKHEDYLLQKRKPNDWVIVWKILDPRQKKLYTPFERVRVKTQTITAKPENKIFPSLGYSFSVEEHCDEKDLIQKGAIHAYKTKKLAQKRKFKGDIIFKAFTQVIDIVGVGFEDVATRKLIIDDKQWKKYHEKT